MLMPMNRRQGLAAVAGLVAAASGTAAAAAAAADVPPALQTLAMAWRPGATPAEDQNSRAHRVGLLALDWARGRSAWDRVLGVPSRAHGLLADGRGGFYAVAARPGDWLVHVPADPDQAPRWLQPRRDESSPRSLNGHLLLSADRRWLFSSETARADGRAWIVRRDADTLRAESTWRLPGVDAHQMLLDADGEHLLVALGGIERDGQGRKVALERMAPALLRVATADGALRQRWVLDDARLSLRHMAWSEDGERRLLGIALQAEHDDREQRRRAPLLALWDGESLTLPQRHGVDGEGYAGDICAGPGGSFLLSAQRNGRALLWHPDAPAELICLAELQEVCALCSWRDAQGLGLLMSAGRGLARWQSGKAQMLPWPEILAPDNHMALPL